MIHTIFIGFIIGFSIGIIYAKLDDIVKVVKARFPVDKKKKTVSKVVTVDEHENNSNKIPITEQYQNMMAYTGKPQKGAYADEN